MIMNQTNQAPGAATDDGVSMGELLARVGRWVDRHYRTLRFVLVAAIALVIVATCALLVIKPPRVTYATVISYNFPQAERGLYPNGAPFSVTDIVSAKVLEAVWSKNQLGDVGLPLNRFIDSVAIVQYAQNEEFIREKYRAMLQRKNLSQTDVAAIEKDFSDELNAASRKQSRLTLTLPFRSGVSGDIASKVLADIPRTWSSIAINELGVSAIPGLTIEGINTELVKTAHPFQVSDYFFKTVATFSDSLKAISTFPGGDTLRDPKTGVGIDDLRQRLSDITRYSIQQFDDFLQESVKVPESQLRSSERSLRELKSQQEEYLAQARVHRQALVDYDAVRLQEVRAPGQGDPRAVQQSNSLQLQGDAIQRLINLGSQNKDAEFRQELTRKRVAAEVSANALEPQIDRLKRRIEASRKSMLRGDASAGDEVKSLANQIAGRLQEVGDALTRLQKVQTVRFLDDGGVLYRSGTVSVWPASSVAFIVAIPLVLVVSFIAGLLFIGAIRQMERVKS
jgi:hypothetical protein